MLNYAQYARKSDDDRSVTEKSISDQLEQLTALRQRESLKVVRSWRESQSAKIPNKRAGYSEMISLIECGKINAILCWNINRLARNMEEGGKLVQLFVEGKIQEIKTPHATYRTGDNILPLVVEAATAAQFSLDHTKDVNRGMTSKFNKGGCNYKAPQGYLNARDALNPDIGILLKDPKRYDVILKGWRMFLTGAYTPRQVVRTLNDVWGYRTRRTKKLPSRPLGPNYGYAMFSNPFYMGYVRQAGKLVRSPEIEPMITEEQFALAQDLLSKSSPKQAPRTLVHAFTGLMVCGYCGRQVTAERKKISTGEIWENYRCSDSDNTCTKRGMARTKVEAFIRTAIEDITFDRDLCEVALKNVERALETDTSELDLLFERQNGALKEAEKQLNNLADMWIRGLIQDEEIYQRKEAEIKKERGMSLEEGDRLRSELERMRANAVAAANYLSFARDAFAVANDELKRELAHALGVKYVFYGREKVIALELNPLLVETVKYVRQIKRSLEPTKVRSGTTELGSRKPAVSFGGPSAKLFELPFNLRETLRKNSFPILSWPQRTHNYSMKRTGQIAM